MSKKYEKPVLDIELFDVEDIITASGDPTDGGDVGETPTEDIVDV
ncbi:MAG TPA: hypothetical protein VFD52_07895 [Clostridia bacterium]|nr:hypothetical protein [Clostridia bacterium]